MITFAIMSRMLDYQITRQERQLVFLMRLWIILFTVAGIAFAVVPDEIVKYLGTIGRTIFNFKALPLEAPTEHFWLVLAISLMAVLIMSAIKAQMDIFKNIFFVKIIIVSKLFSTAGFLVCYFFDQNAFAYLAGAVTDGAIFIVTWLAYHAALKSR